MDREYHAIFFMIANEVYKFLFCPLRKPLLLVSKAGDALVEDCVGKLAMLGMNACMQCDLCVIMVFRVCLPFLLIHRVCCAFMGRRYNSFDFSCFAIGSLLVLSMTVIPFRVFFNSSLILFSITLPLILFSSHVGR